MEDIGFDLSRHSIHQDKFAYILSHAGNKALNIVDIRNQSTYCNFPEDISDSYEWDQGRR